MPISLDSLPIAYKGYRIFRNSISIPKYNPISGHHWTEQKIQNSYYIVGFGSFISDTYRTVKKAKEHIDYLSKIYPPEIIKKLRGW